MSFMWKFDWVEWLRRAKKLVQKNHTTVINNARTLSCRWQIEILLPPDANFNLTKTHRKSRLLRITSHSEVQYFLSICTHFPLTLVSFSVYRWRPDRHRCCYSENEGFVWVVTAGFSQNWLNWAYPLIRFHVCGGKCRAWQINVKGWGFRYWCKIKVT